MKLATLLLLSFTLFPAFHVHASEIVVDKNIVRSITEDFCLTYTGTPDAVYVGFETTGTQNYGFTISANESNCFPLNSLWSNFQDIDNQPFGEGVVLVKGDDTINPDFLNDCTASGTYAGCREVLGYVSDARVVSLRTGNSILGAQGGTEYLASLATTAGQTIDDFYLVAAAALGILLAFLLLGYIMGMFDYNDELLKKTKRLSREVDEHIEKSTESYKAWNRRRPDLFP